MATRTDNTFSEALAKLARQVAEAKQVADADMPFLVQMETMILARIKQPEQQQNQQGMQQQPMPSMGPPQMPRPPQVGMPPGGGGGAMQGAAPNTDELRRMLSQG